MGSFFNKQKNANGEPLFSRVMQNSSKAMADSVKSGFIPFGGSKTPKKRKVAGGGYETDVPTMLSDKLG